MTTKQFEDYKREKDYLAHLKILKEQISIVSQRVDCTKHQKAVDDKLDLLNTIEGLVNATEKRMSNI